MDWTTQKLARFVLETRPGDIPRPVRDKAALCLLDLAGAAWAGHRSTSARALAGQAVEIFGSGPAEVWFTGRRGHPAGAVLANAAAASALDLDDGQRPAAGHPGAAVIPAALAQSAATTADGAEVMAATIMGYEVGCRIGASRDLDRLATLSTGRWVAYGAAAAAGRLAGLDAQSLAQALAIAGVLSPDMAAAGYSRLMGNQVKEGIPWAACLGLLAVDLAGRGLTGPLDILDHPDLYQADRLLAELGREWALTKVYFKPYACCRWIHAALDALLGLMADRGLAGGEIEGIRVETFGRALRLSNETDPSNPEAAQYSLPFCLAVAARHGQTALAPFDLGMLGRPEVTGLARRVELSVDAELDALFPEMAPARVSVTARGQRFVSEVRAARGDPTNPLTRDELAAKFRLLSGPYLPPADQDRLLAAAAEPEKGGLLETRRLLAGPIPS